MRGDRVVVIEASDELDPPAHVLEGVVGLEQQPVLGIDVCLKLLRGEDLRPGGVAVPTPGLAEGAEITVFALQPTPEAVSGRLDVSGVGHVVALVPDVVAAHGGMGAVSADQGDQELAGRGPNHLVIE